MSICSSGIGIKNVDDIVLPFSYATIPIGGDGVAVTDEQNYVPYQLFCLKSRILPFVPGWDIGFTPKRIGDRVHLILEFHGVNGRVDLDSEKRKYIVQLVDDIISHHSDYCLLFTGSVNIEYRGISIPSVWTVGMLPFIDMPDRIYYGDNEKYMLESYYSGQSVFAKLEGVVDYMNAYHRLHTFILKSLFSLYESGSIISEPESEIVRNWGLVNVKKNIYKPSWRNTFYAPDPVRFLWSRLEGLKTISIRIGVNNVRKHFIAAKLRKFQFFFHDDLLVITVDNQSQADNVTDKALSVFGLAQGRVKVEQLKTSAVEGVIYYDVVHGYLQSTIV